MIFSFYFLQSAALTLFLIFSGFSTIVPFGCSSGFTTGLARSSSYNLLISAALLAAVNAFLAAFAALVAAAAAFFSRASYLSWSLAS